MSQTERQLLSQTDRQLMSQTERQLLSQTDRQLFSQSLQNQPIFVSVCVRIYMYMYVCEHIMYM